MAPGRGGVRRSWSEAPRRPYAVFLAEDSGVAQADARAIPQKVRLPLDWTAVPLAPWLGRSAAAGSCRVGLARGVMP